MHWGPGFYTELPLRPPLTQARERNLNPNFLVRISAGGMGVFHVKGWGPKSSVCPSKPRDTKLFGGTSRDFAGISQGRPESLRKKKFVFNSRPLLTFETKFRGSPRTILKIFSAVDTQTAALVSTAEVWISAPDTQTPILLGFLGVQS